MEGKYYQDKIEEMIDASSICEFLENVAAVCHAKSTHIRESWQDNQLAAAWMKVGMLLYHAAVKAEKHFGRCM